MKRQTNIDTLIYNTRSKLDRDWIRIQKAIKQHASARPENVEKAKQVLTEFETMLERLIQSMSGTRLQCHLFTWEQKFELRRKLEEKQIVVFVSVSELG